MGRLVVQMQTSIDGFVSSDNPSSQWQLWDWGPQWPWSPDLRAYFNALFMAADGILLSRPVANEGYLDHWRKIALEHPNDPDYSFAARIGSLPKIIVSGQTVTTLQWPNTRSVAGPFPEAITRAKESITGNLLCFGGAGFVAALLRERLVDELQLYINPGLAGHGKTIFEDAPIPSTFTLLDATPTQSGIVIARWKPSTTTLTQEEC
jgi:dihydrofolate reductase